MAANITFVGGDGDVQVFTWGGLEFTRDTPVLVDPEAAETAEQRSFFEYMIRKAATHPYLTVEEASPAKKKAKAKPAEPAEDDYPEDDIPVPADIPADWRTMHHTALIALAHRLGAGDDVDTKAEAIEFIAGYLKVQAPGGATGPVDF